jgi:hypothetical protein
LNALCNLIRIIFQHFDFGVCQIVLLGYQEGVDVSGIQ